MPVGTTIGRVVDSRVDVREKETSDFRHPSCFSSQSSLNSEKMLSIACEGEIVGAERNEDGSYKILLRGTRIVRIASEMPPEAGVKE